MPGELGRTADIGHGITDDSTGQIEVRQGLTGPMGRPPHVAIDDTSTYLKVPPDKREGERRPRPALGFLERHGTVLSG
jgi:hypothetical protein